MCDDWRLMANDDLEAWLRATCADYKFDLAGIFRKDSKEAQWPVHAETPAELEARLASGGHLLPLPKEPAALANVLEVSIVDFLLARLEQEDGAQAVRGSERGYPDLEISGPAFGGGFHAVDIKAARRASRGIKTNSRITLYTGNTYFKHPDLHWPGTLRSFNSYASHLDVICIYTFLDDLPNRVADPELIVQEPWRIASRHRSSTTREYIGAVDDIASLRAGIGEFSTPQEFYRFWRNFAFKVSPQVQKQYQRAYEATQRELEQYRAAARQSEL